MDRHRFVFAALVLALGATGSLAGKGRDWKFGQWSQVAPFESSAGDTIHFYLFTPSAAAAGKAGQKLPLVVWLHGGVKSNGTGSPSLAQDAFYRDEHQKDHPCFVLRPVAIKGQNWVSPRGFKIGSHKMPAEPSPSMKAVVELIDRTVRDHPVDPARLYVVGASMGGYGTWDIVQRYPGKFAAAMPICGGGDPSLADKLKELAIWISHGDRDPFVPVKGSREMFDALLKAKGVEPLVKDEPTRIMHSSPDGRIRYVEYKGGNHNAAWDKGLTEPELIEWLFTASPRPSSLGRPSAEATDAVPASGSPPRSPT